MHSNVMPLSELMETLPTVMSVNGVDNHLFFSIQDQGGNAHGLYLIQMHEGGRPMIFNWIYSAINPAVPSTNWVSFTMLYGPDVKVRLWDACEVDRLTKMTRGINLVGADGFSLDLNNMSLSEASHWLNYGKQNGSADIWPRKVRRLKWADSWKHLTLLGDETLVLTWMGENFLSPASGEVEQQVIYRPTEEDWNARDWHQVV